MPYDYKVLCDSERHVVLFVEDTPRGTTTFINKTKKEVGFHKLPTAKFHELYSLEYVEYSLAGYANRTFDLQKYGVVINPMARKHLRAIIEQEPLMAKPTAPVSTKTTPVADPKTTPVADPKAKAVKEVAPKEPKAPKDEGETTNTRERREKLDGARKIKKLAANPARVGTTRHAIVETIFAARTVAEALDSTVSRKDGTDYKLGLPDIYFALENGLIELV